jgi:hypothetical protein
MPGRTLIRYSKIYISGYDFALGPTSIGALAYEQSMNNDVAFQDTFKNRAWAMGGAAISVGGINAVLDSTQHALIQPLQGFAVNLMIPIGIQAAPAQADPVFCGRFPVKSYVLSADGTAISITLDQWEAGQSSAYCKPWGSLLHAKAAETAVNSANGYDDGCGAATSLGAWFAWQLFTSNGTVTLKAQDGATAGGAFTDITGLTSGLITAAVTPQSGFVQAANNATIRQFIRWQLVFGTATTATFALALMRG